MACTKVSTLRPGSAPPTRPDETDGGIDQALEIEASDQRRDQQQAGIGHQIGLVEGHANPVDPARY